MFSLCLNGAFIVLIFFTDPGEIALMSLKLGDDSENAKGVKLYVYAGGDVILMVIWYDRDGDGVVESESAGSL